MASSHSQSPVNLLALGTDSSPLVKPYADLCSQMEGASAESQNSSYYTRSCRGFSTTLRYLIFRDLAITSTSLAGQALEGEFSLGNDTTVADSIKD